MAEPLPRAVVEAVNYASRRMCLKSARGVAIYDPATATVVTLGRNAPPSPFVCDGSSACREACSKICEHAEAAALRRLTSTSPTGLELVHVKMVAGSLVAGGPPSCWQCSKAILADRRIGRVWLYRDLGNVVKWIDYSAQQFHMLTLEHCGLPASTRNEPA